MCGALLTFMLKMIYWNFQTKLSDHEICEKRPGPGRDVASVERNNQRPTPPSKFTQVGEEEKRCKDQVMTLKFGSLDQCLANCNQYRFPGSGPLDCAFQFDCTALVAGEG